MHRAQRSILQRPTPQIPRRHCRMSHSRKARLNRMPLQHRRQRHRPDNTFGGIPKRLLNDQKAIWTSPLRLQPQDAIWLVPLAVSTGLLIGSDQHTMTSAIHISPDDQKKASTLSNGSLAAIGALPAGAYVWSLFNHAPQARETGLLAGEALANSLAVSEAFKFVFRRDRPMVNNAAGKFFSSSFSDSSFPSNHATAAWSMAAVVGDEYPGWLTRTVVYGLASTVSVSRVLAEKHFPSDVLIGSTTGWLIGHYIYRAHHDYSLTPFSSPPLPASYRSPPHSRRTRNYKCCDGRLDAASGQRTSAECGPPAARSYSQPHPAAFRSGPRHHRLNQRPHGQLDISCTGAPGGDGPHTWTKHLHPALDTAGVPASAQRSGGTIR